MSGNDPPSGEDAVLTIQESDEEEDEDVVLDDWLPPFPDRIVIKTGHAESTAFPTSSRIPVISSSSRDTLSYEHVHALPPLRSFERLANVPDRFSLKRQRSKPSTTSQTSTKRFHNSQKSGQEFRGGPSSLIKSRTADPSFTMLHMQRETPCITGRPSGSNSANIFDRRFYLSITPNLTILDVQHPQLFLRKFSPDGRHFVAFNADLRLLCIHRYQGIQNMGKYFPNLDNADISEENIAILQRDIFKTLFEESYRVRAVPSAQHSHLLCRDFSLFTKDSKFVIVATSGPTETLGEEDGPAVLNSNESLPFFSRSPPDDYRFVLCSLETGVITDLVEFNMDRIQTTHNSGVYLYEDTLAIFSLQHQRIHFFQILDGKFIPTKVLGQYCFGETEARFSGGEMGVAVPAGKEEFMSTLKQKLLLCVWKRAQADAEKEKNNGPLMEFHRTSNFYRRLKMWKFQILDDTKLLIKWAPEDVVVGRTASVEAPNYPQFFTFFDMTKCRFVGMFENREPIMLKILEKFRDDFRNPPAQHPHFQSDSHYSRPHYERMKRLTVNARGGGGIQEACCRLLTQLPVACQSHTPSPYMDMALFQYEASLVSTTGRIKSRSDEPIKFYSHQSGLRKFTLHASRHTGSGRRNRDRRTVSYIFHPNEPFIISSEKAGSQFPDSDVCFHVRRPIG